MDVYITTQQINFGVPILPIKRVELFSPAEWEEFIEEWMDLKKKEYVEVDRLGGAGDKGRDVVAYKTDKKQKNYKWDCFQCKHYNDALVPTDIYKEIGKILYYIYSEEYPAPDAYYFVAPKGCGTSLSKLLQDADALRRAVINNWASYCQKNITVDEIKLEAAFKDFVENFDFEIFNKISPKTVIEEHTKHPNHKVRFGGGLPSRPVLGDHEIPKDIQDKENVYVTQLLLAYGSDCSQNFLNLESLPSTSAYIKHFERTRINFHHAEQLRNFSRDNLPIGVYEDLQDQVLDGLVHVVEEEYTSGYQKVKDAENHVTKIVLGANALTEFLRIRDRYGICHQLTNDGKILWILK